MKKLIYLIAAIMMILLCPLTAFASETAEEQFPGYEQQMEASGANELIDVVPDRTKDLLNEYGIKDLSPQSILSLKPGNIMSLLWKLLLEQIAQPLRTVSCILAIVVLCALLEATQSSFAQGTMHSVFSIVSTICVAGILVAPVVKCIMECANLIRSMCDFMLCFIPVMTTVVAASGQPITAGAYNLFLFAACEVIAKIAATTLIPMLCIYLAFCLVSAVTPHMKLTPVSTTLKSILCWSLGFLMTLFVGMLSLQSIVSVSADTVTMKATKFAVSNLIPVVGGALSDAMGSVQACMKVMKSSVGAFGIIVAVMTFLPFLIKIGIWMAAVKLSSLLSDMLSATKISGLLQSVSTALSLMFSILLCCGLFLTITTTFMMVLGNSL